MSEDATPIDQSGQQNQFQAGSFHRSQDTGKTKTWHFSRTFQHFADNDPNFAGLSVNFANKTATFTESWQWIPYQNLRSSITPRQWKVLGANSRLLRVKKLGFKVHNMQTISQDVAAQAGSQKITNQFVSQPFAMYGIDRDRITYDMVTTSTDTDTVNRNKVNSNMMDCWPADYDTGKLKPITWNLGKEFAESLGGTTQIENTTARGTVNCLNGFMDVSFSTSGEFSHTWHGHADALDRWYAIGKYVTVPDPKKKPRTPFPLPESLTASQEIGVIESNCGTDINRNYQGAPEPAYIKIVPIHHMTAPVNVTASFFITYFCEVETLLQPSASFLTINSGAPISGSKVDPYSLGEHAKWNFNRERDIYRWRSGFSYQLTKRKYV